MYGLPFVELENKNYGKRKRGTPGKKTSKRAYFRWLILVRALELCGTGKHPNINVETQVPLELVDLIYYNYWEVKTHLLDVSSEVKFSFHNPIPLKYGIIMECICGPVRSTNAIDHNRRHFITQISNIVFIIIIVEHLTPQPSVERAIRRRKCFQLPTGGKSVGACATEFWHEY